MRPAPGLGRGTTPGAPLNVTQRKLEVATGVPPRRINEIVHGTRRISGDTALRLARYVGTPERGSNWLAAGEYPGVTTTRPALWAASASWSS